MADVRAQGAVVVDRGDIDADPLQK